MLQKVNQKTIHTMLKQSIGLDHQLWQLEAKVTLVVFNHLKEKNLILSSNWWVVHIEPRNNLWFLSVHTTHMQASQMNCKKERYARESLVEYVNGTKWSRKEVYSTTEMSIHECTNG
jgi:hypothetical protein